MEPQNQENRGQQKECGRERKNRENLEEENERD